MTDRKLRTYDEYMNVYGRPVRVDDNGEPMSEKEYKICTTCEIDHYENCHTCFGFGVKLRTVKWETIPISAGDVIDKLYIMWEPCPECGSTPEGLPSERV